MKAKNILAYFNSPEQAEETLADLKELKLKMVDHSIRRVESYPGRGNDHIENPINGDFPGLGYLTLNGDFTNSTAKILAATSVSASGMSSGSPENRVTGVDTLLTVVIEEDDYKQAMQIIKNAGATV